MSDDKDKVAKYFVFERGIKKGEDTEHVWEELVDWIQEFFKAAGHMAVEIDDAFEKTVLKHFFQETGKNDVKEDLVKVLKQLKTLKLPKEKVKEVGTGSIFFARQPSYEEIEEKAGEDKKTEIKSELKEGLRISMVAFTEKIFIIVELINPGDRRVPDCFGTTLDQRILTIKGQFGKAEEILVELKKKR